MQQTQRFIHSVSDLYITDEIDLLLEEIKDLEPACYQLEDLQDFDIAGSRADELSLPIELESPIGTITSWDSHINYRHHMNQPPLPWGVALHCHAKHFKSRTGIVRILLVVNANIFTWCSTELTPLTQMSIYTYTVIISCMFGH